MALTASRTPAAAEPSASTAGARTTRAATAIGGKRALASDTLKSVDTQVELGIRHDSDQICNGRMNIVHT